MRVAHFDCFSGISGDMTLAALLHSGVPLEPITEGLASLGLPIRLEVEEALRGVFVGLQVKVVAPAEQPHRFLRDIREILDRGALTPGQRRRAVDIFERLAAAEAAVHGMSIDQVHFHEVGALDSVADIVGVAIGLDHLQVDKFTARPVPTGQGWIKGAHGTMPIPTPGTAALLKGIPLAPSDIKAELTTPTGAAILASVVTEWTWTPAMTITAVGYGAGSKDFCEQPNMLRLMVGTADGVVDRSTTQDQLWQVETNLDDVPPELIGYAFERLFEAGAVDVYTQPILMKKNRPGVMLCALVPAAALAAVEEVMFTETATFGIRRVPVTRSTLQREATTVATEYGPVRAKRGWRNGRTEVVTPEYEDCARIAREHRVPLREVYQAVQRAVR